MTISSRSSAAVRGSLRMPKSSMISRRTVARDSMYSFRVPSTMASAEIHFLRARLQGGKLHKAQKGELRFPLPVGFCYDAESRIIPDPAEEVRGAVSLVFR